VRWRVITHGLCSEMGWDGATVNPAGLMGDTHTCAGVSMCVPADTLEQMLLCFGD
jgi:hypothetical protein